MPRRWLSLISLMTVLLLVAVAALALRGEGEVRVDVVTLERGDIRATIRVTGRVINDRTVTLTALVDGQITGMLVQKGDRVAAGQVLAHLDRREADALLHKAEEVAARERETVRQLTRKLERQKEVASAGGVADQTVEDIALELSSARAALRVAEADLRVARIHREKVEVTAPFAGVITAKSTEVGQWVEAGVVLFTLVADEGREIEANVDAGDSGAVTQGQTVILSCDAFPGREWTERVQWIAPAITEGDSEALNTFAVRMSLGPDAPPLLLGQQTDARIVTARRHNVLKLPFAALMENAGRSQVAVVRDGLIQLVPVVTGLEDLTHVEIVEGLEEGAVVALPSGKPLREGQPVVVNMAEEAG